jgi:hypothetical protein
MFDRLRLRLIEESKVSVGILGRTSVIASNRLVARVDPSASANLTLGEETNILQAVTQLTELVTTAQTGGISTILGHLNGLDRLPKDAPPAVYGLTTGNTFKITPIFDPSGQALRFRFDHVYSSPIQEPNGTVNPQLQRIERHGINTQVQISNHEIRTISRFDSTAKVGLAPRRGGGVPVLNEIPLIRDIPLIGWFTLSKGRAAVVQQSLMLGHTTMFPTIGDIADLLTKPIMPTSQDPLLIPLSDRP